MRITISHILVQSSNSPLANANISSYLFFEPTYMSAMCPRGPIVKRQLHKATAPKRERL